MGEDLFCEKDPSMENLKVRFYDITVTASDSAGNTGSDTCKVIIVPRCSPSHDDSCEMFQVDSTDSRSSGNGNAGKTKKENFYYTLDSMEAAVVQSQILYQVAEAELVWEHELNSSKFEGEKRNTKSRKGDAKTQKEQEKLSNDENTQLIQASA